MSTHTAPPGMTRAFWIGTAERVIATGVAVAIPLITVTDVDWRNVAQVTLLAMLTSFGKALLAASPAIPGDGPSLVTAEQTQPVEPRVTESVSDVTDSYADPLDYDLPVFEDDG